MRFNPDFPPDTHQPLPIDRAITLLIPAGFHDELVSELSVADRSTAAPPDRALDRTPGLGARLLGFLLRPN